jgi:hypothetical protein
LQEFQGAGEIAAALRAFDTYDRALISHGSTSFGRDYELWIDGVRAPVHDPHGVRGMHLHVVFRGCGSVTTASVLSAESWRASLDDSLIESGVEVSGATHAWRQLPVLHPGIRLDPESSSARAWSERLGIPLHEVVVETNRHETRIVFISLRLELVPANAPGGRDDAAREPAEYALLASERWRDLIVGGASPSESAAAVLSALDVEDPTDERHAPVILAMAAEAWSIGRLDADLRERALAIIAGASHRSLVSESRKRNLTTLRQQLEGPQRRAEARHDTPPDRARRDLLAVLPERIPPILPSSQVIDDDRGDR